MLRKDFLKWTGAISLSGLTPLNRVAKRYRTPLLKPPPLRPGDTIGLVAPAGIVYEEEEFKRMEQVLREMNLKVVFGKHVRQRHGYFAGTDQQRVEDLNRLFSDPEIDGILAVRGGWGSNRLLSLINYDAIRKHPKFFCGFSDITSLHLSIHAMTGLVTFHGPNGTADWTRFTQNQFRAMAFGFEILPELRNPPVEQKEIRTIYPGTAQGHLVGGNLTLITSMVGSSYLPDMQGAILFLEDIEEDVYRVDRMFSQLELAGLLDKISGLVFGRCTRCRRRPGASFTLSEILGHYLRPRKIPSFYGSMISHEANIFTVPVGIQAEMFSESGAIRLLESPVHVKS